MSYLLEWLLPDTRAGSLVVDAQIGAGPNGGFVKKFPTPFHIAFNTELDLYPWLELPENKSRVKRFGHAMTSSRQFEMKDDLLHG